jgi:beta-galactosidase
MRTKGGDLMMRLQTQRDVARHVLCRWTIVLLGFVMPGLPAMAQQDSPRQVYDFNFDWLFHKGDVAGAEAAKFDDGAWRKLRLPHDWSIEEKIDRNAPASGGGGYFPTGVGWYRKHFQAPDRESGRRVWIEFDGVYEDSTVWINGHELGFRPYGYIGFQYDLTPHLVPGDNVIAVKVNNSNQPNSRWYSGSGIYRNVRLVAVESLHLGPWGVYFTTPEATRERAKAMVRTTVRNQSGQAPGNAMLRTILLDPEGREVAQAEIPLSVGVASETTVEQSLTVDNPRLWGVDAPQLYSLHSIVLAGGRPSDAVVTPVGIRHIEYSPKQGFRLNGERVKMLGVNLHHDGGPVGAAVPRRVWERRFETLKALGVNAIRTAHNPMAPEFLDLCDEMGFLVMNELFDEWKSGKRTHGYHVHFDEWWERDAVDFIRRDRNHPSVVMWSAGNEIGEQSSRQGHRVLAQLMEVFHREDPTRPVTTGNDHIAADGRAATPEFLNMLDIVGYNYMDRWHERREIYISGDRINHPDWLQVGTESTAVRGSRGPAFRGRRFGPQGPDEMNQQRLPRGLIRAQELWKFVALHDYVIGDFMWTGIDYLGESFWPSTTASAGLLDRCGFIKPNAWFYKSQWVDEPMVEFDSHWNWPERVGDVLPVVAYSNCDAVRLYVNGRFHSEKRLEFPRQGNSGGWNRYATPKADPTTTDLFLTWDVSYEPGVLKAEGYRNGELVVTRELHTAGEPAALRLSLDREQIAADAYDVAHLTVQVLDEQGQLSRLADTPLTIEVEGAGELLAFDNGNPIDHTPFLSKERNAYGGMALAMVRSTKEAGTIRVTVSGEDLGAQSVTVTTR